MIRQAGGVPGVVAAARGGSIAGLAIAGLLGALAGVAGAVAAPDPALLARLQAACDSAWRVRLTGRRATYLVRRPSVDSSGLSWTSGSGRAAIVTAGDAREPEKRLAWSEIERLDAARSRAGRGALVGAVVGAVTGAALVAANGPDLTDANDNIVTGFAVLLTASTTVLGALLGFAYPAVHPLYP